MSIAEQTKAQQKDNEQDESSENKSESTMEAKQGGNLPGRIAAFCKRSANQISSPSLLKQRLGKEDAGDLKKLRNNE